ncbi:MAG: PilN domain-containing protein [Polyangiaceae bacterium]
MVRINLLPQKKELRRAAGEGGQTWLLAIAGVLLFEAIVLVFVHRSKQNELAALASKSREIQTSIDTIKSKIKDHDSIKSQLTELRAREDAISKLQSSRIGPTAMMLELAHILTNGRGPSADRDKLEQLKRDNPNAYPNMGWDSRRLWIDSFKEGDRKVRITGFARDGEDVSEFLKRLTLSEFFADVTLMPAVKVVDTTTKVELLKFELSAKVKY